MKLNVAELTNEELQELEDYIVENTSEEYMKYAKNFTKCLNNEKWNDKNLDINSFDKIYEGLADIIFSWINTKKIEDNQISIIDIICSKHTKIGKFLKRYNYQQISFEEAIKLLKEKDRLVDVLKVIADIQVKKERLKLNEYDLNHTKRTLFLVNMLMTLRNDLSKEEQKIIFKAVEFHDIGRISDYNDLDHGQRAIKKLTNELDNFNIFEQKLIKSLILEHCKSYEENEKFINLSNMDDKYKDRFRLYLNYVKDSDKLDRVRFPEVSELITNALDPERLKFEEAKCLIKFACELLINFDSLLNTDDGDDVTKYITSPLYDKNGNLINISGNIKQENYEQVKLRNELIKSIKNNLKENKIKIEIEAKSNQIINKEKNNVFRFF